MPDTSKSWVVANCTRPVLSQFGILLLGLLTLLLLGCASAATATQSPVSTTVQSAAAPTSTPITVSDSPVLAGDVEPLNGATITIGAGSVARYLVREQLAGVSLPNDAIGETSDVDGSITLNADGTIDSDLSAITVDLTTLQSDEDRRDRYLRTRSLQSSTFPTARFVVKETPGLPWPLPAEGQMNFQIEGDMTLHGVTRPLTWEVTAQVSEGSVSGLAQTSFTFQEFNLDVPSVSVVINVENNIRLEIDFTGSVA